MARSVIWTADDYRKQVELNRRVQAGDYTVWREPQQYSIIVRAIKDMEPGQEGDCYILEGIWGAFNVAKDVNRKDLKVKVWNQSENTIDAGIEFKAEWTQSENTQGQWVSSHLDERESVEEASKVIVRAITLEQINDGSKGNIEISGSTQTGIWEHATSGLNLLPDGDIWVYGPDDNGEWEIIGVDCRYVEEPI